MLVAGQGAIGIVVAMVCGALMGAGAAWAALAGSGIGVAASGVQVAAAFRRASAGDPKAIARGFYRGEALKIAVTVALFVIALSGRRMPPGPLFAGYVATFAAFWVALLRMSRGGGPG